MRSGLGYDMSQELSSQDDAGADAQSCNSDGADDCSQEREGDAQATTRQPTRPLTTLSSA